MPNNYSHIQSPEDEYLINSYMYRSTYPSDRSIEEAITNHFIKFGKQPF